MISPRTLQPTAPAHSLSQQALLVISPTGRVQFATARAAAWLKSFSVCPSNRLPRALTGWLNELPRRPRRFILDREGTQLWVQMIWRDSKSVCLLLEQRAPPLARDGTRALLTERQIEVLSWVARGKTNAEIGKILSLKPKTIGKYLERIFPKLGVENRTAAASFALGTNESR